MTSRIILIVEDIEISRDMACDILKRLGYIVDIAENGAIAVEKVKSNTYDMIFMNVRMPIISGCEATRVIRQDLGIDNQKLPIIGLTTHFTPEEISSCYEAGMDDILVKPFEFMELAEKAEEWLIGESESWDITEQKTISYSEAPIISISDLENLISFIGSDRVQESYNNFVKDTTARLLAISISSAKEDLLHPTLHNITAGSGSLGMKKLSLYTQHLLKQGVARDRLVEDAEIKMIEDIFQDSCQQFQKNMKK